MMVVMNAKVMIPILLILRLSQAVEYEVPLADATSSQDKSSLLILDFVKILRTEINNELANSPSVDFMFDDDSMGRNLLENEKIPHQNHVWDHVLEHGWHIAENLSKYKAVINKRRKLKSKTFKEDRDIAENDDSLLPFVVCSRTPLLHTGSQRLPPIKQFTGVKEEDIVIISNDDDQTCFYVPIAYKEAKIIDSALSNDEYVILPLTDLMKISESSFELVQSSEWSVPSPEKRFRDLLHGKEEHQNDWERIIRVTFASGRDLDLSAESLMLKGETILSDVKTMGEGSLERRRTLSNATSTTEEHFSLSDAFSLTSSISLNSKNSHRARSLSLFSRMDSFARSLELGLEASHSCIHLFDTLSIRPIFEDNGIDVVLNPDMDTSVIHKLLQHGVESSTANPHCVISLIVGLSVHPQVLNVEVDTPVSPLDYQSQWITQSNVQGSRPLFDSGLTGKGQIVSVSDSGLDIQHNFFGPTNDDVYHKWVMTERKVVRYEHDSAGDTSEAYQGHGTRVAGVIAGSLSSRQEHEADGIAKDAKIHMWDIHTKGRGFSAPGPNKMFKGIYFNGMGAKITNGSWSAGYKPYSIRCRMYDSSLRDSFDEILFVASAGNSGNDVPGEVMNTIQEPSSCKNVLAVGASQSHGERIYTGDKGKNYLADFSSRGPTNDGRMKPEVVAVGYTILAPRAHASENNQEDTCETFGTSFSAPVVSGSAALIRQYFEEGWFPCGKKGCNKAISPCGALVKAVLMNGAESLLSVQKVPSGPITDSLTDYDNNQGFGLINLAKSIPIKKVNDFNAVAVNNRAIKNGETDTIVIQTKYCSSKELAVTITWYDPPGAAHCTKCLVNDLDLSVQDGRQIFYPNGKSHPDRINNSERVRMEVQAGHKLEILVKAHNLATESQKYSLIATGCFDSVA